MKSISMGCVFRFLAAWVSPYSAQAAIPGERIHAGAHGHGFVCV